MVWGLNSAGELRNEDHLAPDPTFFSGFAALRVEPRILSRSTLPRVLGFRVYGFGVQDMGCPKATQHSTETHSFQSGL